MRRRLDLAAALVASPPVLFLDEPTTGLDPQSRLDLWRVIEGPVSDGTTVLLTTQYLGEADRLASELAVVDHGRVIAAGTPAALKADLGTTVVEIVVTDEASLATSMEVLRGIGGRPPRVSGTTIELPANAGPGVAMEALRRLDQANVVPVSFMLREPSLDDVFLTLTGRPPEDGTNRSSALAPKVEA